jgi:hypothetical protein
MFSDSVVTLFEALSRRYLDGLRKTTTTLMQDTEVWVRYLLTRTSSANSLTAKFGKNTRRTEPRRQDRHCKHNVTLCRIQQQLLQWESENYYMFILDVRL